MFVDRGFSKVIGQINEWKQSHACKKNGVNDYDEQQEVSNLVCGVISDWHLSKFGKTQGASNEFDGS
jgi:hypothetical protein